MRAAADIGQWVEADLDFHTAVLRATNNPLLMPLAAIIGSALASLLAVTARSASDFRRGLPDHEKVFEAIEGGDAQSALHRMAGMLADTRTLMKQAALSSAPAAGPTPASSAKIAPHWYDESNPQKARLT
jgi:DNA-binding FadR family transcriptional regulator